MSRMSLTGCYDEVELCIRNEAAADDPSRKFRPVANERRTDRCERCRLDELGRMLLQIRVIGDFGRPILVDCVGVDLTRLFGAPIFKLHRSIGIGATSLPDQRSGNLVDAGELGRESCRDRVCQYQSLEVVSVTVKKTPQLDPT